MGSLVKGKPDIRHPEIVEQKLAAVGEITNYILAYRAEHKK